MSTKQEFLSQLLSDETMKSIDNKVELITQALEELMIDLDQIPSSNISKAVGKYIILRDKLGSVRKAYTLFEDSVKGRQETLNVMMVQKGQEDGVDSFKTPLGTAFKKVKNSYRVQDWETFSAWLIENDNMHCVEKRAAKTAVEEIHNETGEVPPGLDHIQEIEYQFRKS